MGLTTLNPEATQDFIHPKDAAYPDNKDGSATVFQLGIITLKAKAIIDRATSVTGDGGMNNFGGLLLETVRYGLKGWYGLKDPTGAAVEPEFVGKGNLVGLSDTSLLEITPFITEIAAAILELNSQTEAEEKN